MQQKLIYDIKIKSGHWINSFWAIIFVPKDNKNVFKNAELKSPHKDAETLGWRLEQYASLITNGS